MTWRGRPGRALLSSDSPEITGPRTTLRADSPACRQRRRELEVLCSTARRFATTSSSSAAAGTSACRWRSRWPTAARRSSSTTSARPRSTWSTPAMLPFDEPGAADELQRRGGRRSAARHDRSRRSSADAENVDRRHRHAGRRAPQPRPAGDPARARARARRTSATASCWSCAARSSRASPRSSSG